MSFKRILLAEDDPLGVELTLAALKENHLDREVQVVADGEEALDYLYRRGDYSSRPAGNPFVFLLDLKMPRVDGLQVLKALQADAQMASIPVVVLTSSRLETDKLNCYRAGANAYVVKPVDFNEFTEAVRHMGAFWGKLNEPPPPMPDLCC